MPPKAKRSGRPIKKFPDLSGLPNFVAPSMHQVDEVLTSIDDDSEDLNTLANAAQSVDFNWEKAWPKLDHATDRLEHIKTLRTDRGLSKENRKQLVTAVNSLHTLLVAPSSILDNTPDLYKDEFKNRATALTTAYLQFSLDVVPKKDDAEKVSYLQMLLDKLIKPIREQPSLWGPHSLQITTAASRWDEVRKSVKSDKTDDLNPSAISTDEMKTATVPQPIYHPPGPQPHYHQQNHPYIPDAPHPMYPPHGYHPANYGMVPAGHNYGYPNQAYPAWIPPTTPFDPRAPRAPISYPAQYPGEQHAYHNSISQRYVPPEVERTNASAPAPHRPSPLTPTKQFQHEGISETSQSPVSDVMDITTNQSPLPLRRPKPSTPSARAAAHPRTDPSQHLNDAAKVLADIRRHPAYSPEMCEVHGYIPTIVKVEVEESDEDEPLQLLSPPALRKLRSQDAATNSKWQEFPLS